MVFGPLREFEASRIESHVFFFAWEALEEAIGLYRRPDTTFQASTCDIVLTDIGLRKIAVVKVIRGMTDTSLAEAKALIRELPALIKEDVSLEEAEEIRELFEDAGAKVSFEARGSEASRPASLAASRQNGPERAPTRRTRS